MVHSDLIDKIKNYTGKNFYIHTLKTFLANNQSLSDTQLLLAKKLLTIGAIKADDKELLPQQTLKEYDIDWSKYEIKMPYDFQKHGINWLLNNNRAVLADDMGLGKSLQTIIAALESNIKKILIVCPASLKINWQKEIAVFNSNVTIINKDWRTAQFTIINYDILHKYADKILNGNFDLIIADEAHMLKSGHKSRRGKNFIKASRKIRRIWLLTGTPIANRPIDYYNLLKICRHELGKRKDEFAKRYCGGKSTPWGWDTKGASNLKELHFKTQDILLRRTKDKVLNLPPKIRTPIWLELPSRKAYNSAVEDRFNEIYEESFNPDSEYFGKDIEKGSQFVELAVLRKFTALEKIKDGSTLELIDNALEQGKKIVIFTNYLSVIDSVKEQLGDKCLTLDGRLSLEQRQRNIDLFQSGNGPSIIVCNIAIAAVGITLTKASVAIMNDLPWSPASLIQAEDRIYRIGQTERVNIIYPIYSNTIDEVMFHVLQEKVKNINEAIEGKTDQQLIDITTEVYRKLKTAA